MTGNEVKAIKRMQNVRDDAVVTLDHIQKNEPNVSPMLYKGRKQKAETIIAGFEELEAYRAIGTVEELKEAKEVYNEILLSEGKINVPKECIAYEVGKLREKELREYKAIGTIEEFKALKEKSVPKKPIVKGVMGFAGEEEYHCPNCNQKLMY